MNEKISQIIRKIKNEQLRDVYTHKEHNWLYAFLRQLGKKNYEFFLQDFNEAKRQGLFKNLSLDIYE
jgi:predicted nucleic acid-binding OB-fold protein